MAKASLCLVGEAPTMNGGVTAVRLGCLGDPKQIDHEEIEYEKPNVMVQVFVDVSTMKGGVSVRRIGCL